MRQSPLCTNNLSQNQHMRLMINHFLITKHGEDNWKIPSGRGTLKRYFCVYSTTGTNSEAEAPGGPVCLWQNWFTKAECTSAESEANSCLLPPWKSTAEVSQLKPNLYCWDMLRITVLRLTDSQSSSAFWQAEEISPLLLPAVRLLAVANEIGPSSSIIVCLSICHMDIWKLSCQWKKTHQLHCLNNCK